MKIKFLYTPYYLGLSTLLVGILFKIQHWQGGLAMSLAGRILESIFFVLVIVEILTSKKATNVVKYTWASIYLASGIVAGLFLDGMLLIIYCATATAIYARIGRRRFLRFKGDAEPIVFDFMK